MENNYYLSSTRISLFQIYVKYFYLDLTSVQLYSIAKAMNILPPWIERVTTKLIEEISAKYF